MSTTTLDVNQAFAAERASQIEAASAATAAWDARVASGELKPIPGSPGQFIVDKPGSWDNGEIFSQVNGIPIPQAGLDMVDGKAQLYTAVPTWHNLGTVIPGGISDVDQVLDIAGLNWPVLQADVQYMHEGQLLTMPDNHVNLRGDTGRALGVVGKVYEPWQNREAFQFLEELAGTDYAVWESAGPLRGGRKVFVSMKMPEGVVVDEGGIGERIDAFLVAINSHDGLSPFQVVATPWRPVCGNTERFSVRDAYTRWSVRHTSGASAKRDEARRAMKLSSKYWNQFAAEETTLARLDLQLAEFDGLMAELFPLEDDPSKQQIANKAKRDDYLAQIFATESERVGRTAYAAERSVTDYLDHVAPKRALGGSMAAARATAVLEGSADDVKSRAHARLLTLVNR